jgi:hypothetical protein
MNTRIVSLNHPAVSVAKLVGRKAVAPDGRVGILEADPLGGFLPVVGFSDRTWVSLGGSLVKLVVEENK